MSRLVKIADANEVAAGQSKLAEVEGKSIALFNLAGTFYAIDNTCTHMGGPLDEGELTGDVVACPWHGAKFNVKTGAVLCTPARQAVRSYAVKLQGNNVMAELD